MITIQAMQETIDIQAAEIKRLLEKVAGLEQITAELNAQNARREANDEQPVFWKTATQSH